MDCAQWTQLRVFFAGAARGNAAAVAALPTPPTTAVCTGLAATAPRTCCVVWPDAQQLQVRCYSGGQPVERCGHGLLAAAFWWFSRRGHLGVLSTATEHYQSIWEDGNLWLCAPRIHCDPCAPPPQAAGWFASPPVAGAVTRSPRGYRILEWPSGTDLAHIEPRLERLRREETRAVIATQASAFEPWNFTLRYFAPQYGTAEDDATGSAAMVLADYWAGRLGGGDLVALQCSPGGGVIRSRLDGAKVRIGGSVRIEEAVGTRDANV